MMNMLRSELMKNNKLKLPERPGLGTVSDRVVFVVVVIVLCVCACACVCL